MAKPFLINMRSSRSGFYSVLLPQLRRKIEKIQSFSIRRGGEIKKGAERTQSLCITKLPQINTKKLIIFYIFNSPTGFFRRRIRMWNELNNFFWIFFAINFNLHKSACIFVNENHLKEEFFDPMNVIDLLNFFLPLTLPLLSVRNAEVLVNVNENLEIST